jgi:hypothetical protein
MPENFKYVWLEFLEEDDFSTSKFRLKVLSYWFQDPQIEAMPDEFPFLSLILGTVNSLIPKILS